MFEGLDRAVLGEMLEGDSLLIDLVDALNEFQTLEDFDMLPGLLAGAVMIGTSRPVQLYDLDNPWVDAINQAWKMFPDKDGSIQAFCYRASYAMICYYASNVGSTRFSSVFYQLGWEKYEVCLTTPENAIMLLALYAACLHEPEPKEEGIPAAPNLKEVMSRPEFYDSFVKGIESGLLMRALLYGRAEGEVCIPAKIVALIAKLEYENEPKIYSWLCGLPHDEHVGPYVSDYKTYPWTSMAAQSLKADNPDYGAKLFEAIRKAMEDGWVSKEGHGVVRHCQGERMMWWIKQNPDRGLGLHSDECPDAIWETENSGCVAKGTLISLADGTQAPIEGIACGDQVLTAGGGIGICSSELVVNDGVRILYSVNEDEPFMSPEHAVLTQDGFKCLDPEAARAIDPHVQVSLLKVGDILNKARVSKDGTMEYVLEEVRRINVREVPPGAVRCYDLHFAEGSHSYHANGYVCLLNYPQITVAGVRERLGRGASAAKARENRRLLAESNAPEALFGGGLGALVRELLAAPIEPLRRAANPYLEQDRMTLRFQKIVFETDGNELTESQLKVREALSGGILLHDGWIFALGGVGGPRALQAQRNGSGWAFRSSASSFKGRQASQKAEQIGDLAGILGITLEGTHAKGSVLADGRPMKFSASNSDTFILKRNGVNFGSLSMGSTDVPLPDGTLACTTVASLSLQNQDGALVGVEGCSVSFGHRRSVTESGREAVLFCMDLNLPTLGSMALSNVGISCPQCIHLVFDELVLTAREDLSLGEDHGITAILEGFDDCQALLESCERLKREALALQQPYASTIHAYRPPLLAPAEEKALTIAKGLSVEELYSLPIPSLESLHRNAYASLETVMLSQAPDELLEVYGRTRPTSQLDSVEKAVSQTHAEYLSKCYAIGCGCQTLQDETDSYVRAYFDEVDSWQERLDYYMQGDDADTCLGGSEEFAAIMNELVRDAYLQCVPGLKEYASEQPERWAKNLHAYATHDVNLRTQAQFSHDDDNLGCFRNTANVLDLLDDTPQVTVGDRTLSYGSDYLDSASKAAYSCIAASIDSIPEGFADAGSAQLEEFVSRTVRVLYDAAIYGTPYRGQALSQEERDEIAQGIGGMSEKDWVEVCSGATRNALLLFEGSSDHLLEWMRRAGMPACLAGSLIFSVVSLAAMISGSDKSTESIIETSLTAVESVLCIADLVIIYRMSRCLGDTAMTVEEILEVVSNVSNSGAMFRYLGGNWGSASAEIVFDGPATDVARCFKASRSLFKACNVVLSGAFAVLSIYDAVADWEDENSLGRAGLVMDTVANTVMFGLAVAEVCSFAIPGAGVVLGIAVLISITGGFLEKIGLKTHVPSPSEEFMKNYGKAFLESLPMPSEYYLERRKKEATLLVP